MTSRFPIPFSIPICSPPNSIQSMDQKEEDSLNALRETLSTGMKAFRHPDDEEDEQSWVSRGLGHTFTATNPSQA